MRSDALYFFTVTFITKPRRRKQGFCPARLPVDGKHAELRWRRAENCDILIAAMIDKKILSILEETGPLTGAQLVERSGADVFSVWQACRKEPTIRLETAGCRYLRLDRSVQGFARLSPSIRREFLTYTYAGLYSQAEALMAKVEELGREIRRISEAKREIAAQTTVAALENLEGRDVLLAKACFIIAGDVVYNMSHTVSRPEKSTGEMVRGSDLDIIVVVEDNLDPEILRSLDLSIHKKKHRLLVNDREEIDYLIKTVSRVRAQLQFDIFSSKVAAKILDEGQFLYGNPEIYQRVKNLIIEFGVPGRLKSLEQQAAASRALAESELLEVNAEKEGNKYLNLFYTHAEEDEIY